MSAPDPINNDRSIRPVEPGQQPRTDRPSQAPDGTTFGDVLRRKVAEQMPASRPGETRDGGAPVAEPTVRWSAHAEARLRQRGIEIGPIEQARVERAIDRAASKGSREAVVMMDDVAMVASVTNRTVITAIAQDQARENVFTNIDAVVFA